jgi:outer membrane lipoprotein SlyB
MKKLMAAILSLVLLSATALPAMAQGRNRSYVNQGYSQRADSTRNRYDNRQQRVNYDNRQQVSYGRSSNGYDNRGFWDQHRDKLTTVIGALGGALIGSAVGGGRGAAIGALAGAGGAALYTYKIRNRNQYYQY